MDVFTLLGLCVVYGISTAQNTNSNHIFVDDGDEIKPEVSILNRKYTKNQYRKWMLRAPSGVWGLAFQQFSLEYSVTCEHDYLQIQELNNRSTGAVPLRPVRYCGEHVPPPYVSVSPGLEVVFVSDDIWENEGFTIHVLHADTRDKLLAKMEPYTGVSETRQGKPPSDTSSEHPIFYTLIGCSIAAFIIFVLLLTYFIRSIRKRASNSITARVPESLYIQPSEVESQTRKPSVICVAVDSASFGCKVGKSGKRYSKDKTNETVRKTLVPEPRAHYNNLYVTENMPSNG